MSANELKATHEALRLAHEKLNKAQMDNRLLQIEHSFQLQTVARDLNKYKDAVKSLAFDLEMAQTGANALVSESAVRKAALEQAAEFLMDHGVITTGNALVEVCEQIKKLHGSKAAPAKAQEFR
jgi:hypothetical protein